MWMLRTMSRTKKESKRRSRELRTHRAEWQMGHRQLDQSFDALALKVVSDLLVKMPRDSLDWDVLRAICYAPRHRPYEIALVFDP
jgi:hypothetical protein